MAKLIGAISVFNEQPFIYGALLNLVRLCARVVVIDGAYLDFPGDGGASGDGTLEIIRAFPDPGKKIELIESPPGGWADQVTKRNAYLIGEPGDWYLQIDADERFFGDPRLLMETGADGYRVAVEDGHFPPMTPMRFFRHQDGIRYHGAHNAIHIGDRLIIQRDQLPLTDCWIEHFSRFRTIARMEAAEYYYERQYHQERAWREKAGYP